MYDELRVKPEAEPFSLAEVKAWLKVEHSDEDALIAALIGSARERVEQSTGRALITQEWTTYIDRRFPACIRLSIAPVQSVDAVKYVASDGTLTTLSSSDYQVTGLNTLRGVEIEPAYGVYWPVPRFQKSAIQVEFTAGFGDSGEFVPEDIREAMQKLIARGYRFRGDDTEGAMDADVQELIAPHRKLVVA